MAKDTRRRFEIEAQKFRPLIRDAFLQAVADIKRGTDLDALIAAIERNDVPAALTALKLGPEYFAPLDDAVRATFKGGGTYMLDTLPVKNPRTGLELVIRFQGRNPRAESWVAKKSSDLIVEIVTSQRDAVRDVVLRGITEGVNPRQTALELIGRVDPATGRRAGGIVGNTTRDRLAVERMRDELGSPRMASGYFRRKARDKRFDSIVRKSIESGEKLSDEKIRQIAGKYSDKLLQLRGERIARTETLTALNAGRTEGMQQLIDSDEVKKDSVTKEWSSSADKRVRDIHVTMDGSEVDFDQPFISPTGAELMFAGDTSLGAGGEDTVQCRCYTAMKIDFLKGVE